MACALKCSFFIVLAHLLQSGFTDYIAAVVEFQPFTSKSIDETVEYNLKEYVHYIEEAWAKNAQIIVFPENGLTGETYNVSSFAIEIPITGYGPNFTNYWLQKLSNAASGHSMYVVVNLVEKSTDENNKTKYYNTNVVFDKSGKIAAKYRKINLFDEPYLTAGVPSENQITFSTDFGITFGIFTSYDLTYANPSITLLSHSNVTDIVYPAAWTSFLPFYHSISMHSGYAASKGINLLAANLNNPEVGTGGSGMYGADGSVFSYYISGTPGTKLIVANIKNAPQNGLEGPLRGINSLDDDTPPMEKFNASRLFEADKYNFKTLNISQSYIKEEVCYKSFCCQFSMNVTSNQNNTSEVYKIMAYNGPGKAVPSRKYQRICSLLACASSDVNTCGKHNIKLSTKFANILVETSIPINQQRSYFQPFSLTTNLIPVFNTTYEITKTNNINKLAYFTQIPQDNVVAFGLIRSGGSASTSVFGATFFVGVLIFNRLFL